MTKLICEIGASSWFYYKEICYDAQVHESKIMMENIRRFIAIGVSIYSFHLQQVTYLSFLGSSHVKALHQ
jgi:hypothetical protein